MARPAVISIEDKFRLVVSVVSGEMTVAEAARRSKVSEQSISNWKRQFLEGGKQGLADGGRPDSRSAAMRIFDPLRHQRKRTREAEARAYGAAREREAALRYLAIAVQLIAAGTPWIAADLLHLLHLLQQIDDIDQGPTPVTVDRIRQALRSYPP